MKEGMTRDVPRRILGPKLNIPSPTEPQIYLEGKEDLSFPLPLNLSKVFGNPKRWRKKDLRKATQRQLDVTSCSRSDTSA